MRIPPISTYDPQRVMYQIGNQLIFAKKGVGRIDVTKNGTIIINGMKELGLGDSDPHRKGVNMIIKNSGISVLYKNLKDKIYLFNSRVYKPKQKRDIWIPKAEVIYTNRP